MLLLLFIKKILKHFLALLLIIYLNVDIISTATTYHYMYSIPELVFTQLVQNKWNKFDYNDTWSLNIKEVTVSLCK